MITTTLGEMDESTLIKTEGHYEDDIERTQWVEYRQTPDGDIIHRSAHIYLKAGLLAASETGGF